MWWKGTAGTALAALEGLASCSPIQPALQAIVAGYPTYGVDIFQGWFPDWVWMSFWAFWRFRSLDSGIGDAGQHGHAGVDNGLVKDQNCWSPLKVDIWYTP